MLESRGSADSHVVQYRPDLDGMRAVAVCSVIVYHLFERALPGGYLGVDVFFVLSGYLITAIIWRELSLGQFTFAGFYLRRVRRIMPALLLVLLLTTAISVALLLPLDLTGFAKSQLASLAFVANMYFWRDADYFSQLANQKPLLHIWSLGVEEQFYLLVPGLLLLLSGRQTHAITLMALLVIVSSAANFLAPSFGAALPAFYLLPTRAWELGAGALLALVPRQDSTTSKAANVLGGFGITLVVVALALRPTLLGGGWPNLLAVAGTSLLIHAGHSGDGRVGRFLSWRPIVFVGLLSYSLYLWHWPVIVFAKYYLVRDLTLSEGVLAVAIMGAGAWASWRWVERPFRSSAVAAPIIVGSVAAVGAVAGILAAMLIAASGWPSRLPPEAATLNAAVGTNYRCPVSNYLYFRESRACALNLPGRDPQAAEIVLFGNSHAQMYAPLIDGISRSVNKPSLLVPMNLCTPTSGFNVNAACSALAERNLEGILALPHARVVVLATTWVSADPLSGFVQGLDKTIDRLKAADRGVVLIGPLAVPNWDVASVTSRTIAFGRHLERPLSIPRAAFDAQLGRVIRHFAARSDVALVRPDLVQCDVQVCRYVVEGRSLFADHTHLAEAELPRFRQSLEDGVRRAMQ